jgi:serine/threonine protein kinase
MDVAAMVPRSNRAHPGAALDTARVQCCARACDNVVEAHAVEHDSVPALVMEYLPGGDLVPLLGATSEHWLPAFRGAVAALLQAHRSGFAHGDVKARNVLFAADGSARLVDFSAARPLESPAAPSRRPITFRGAFCHPRVMRIVSLWRCCLSLRRGACRTAGGRQRRRRPAGRRRL